ncbi:MerR family transcriptional regulator [Streptomyces sp. NPDC008313]|uniref:MerR family transcriptional regulator n=1 Tax=Streptomyces sp. NPDC008313 TaxID=3364826 RepID=UPI0036EFDC7B
MSAPVSTPPPITTTRRQAATTPRPATASHPATASTGATTPATAPAEGAAPASTAAPAPASASTAAYAKTYSLDEVVRISGLDARTLRWYEDQGLIESAEEDPWGEHAYSPLHLRWLEFLNHLRSTGMVPADMNHYVELYRAGDATIGARRELLEAHRALLRARAEEFESTLRYLDWKIGFYLEREAALARVSGASGTRGTPEAPGAPSPNAAEA